MDLLPRVTHISLGRDRPPGAAVCGGFPNHRFAGIKRGKGNSSRTTTVIDVKVRVRKMAKIENGWRRQERERENINGHGECGFNYCRRRVRVAVYIRDVSFAEIIRAVRWSHSRLHGSQFSFWGFAPFQTRALCYTKIRIFDVFTRHIDIMANFWSKKSKH